jgi:hypothetical protein
LSHHLKSLIRGKNKNQNRQKDIILKKALIVSFEKLNEEPYTSIICYLKTRKATLKNHLNELQKLSVETLGLAGEKRNFQHIGLRFLAIEEEIPLLIKKYNFEVCCGDRNQHLRGFA